MCLRCIAIATCGSIAQSAAQLQVPHQEHFERPDSEAFTIVARIQVLCGISRKQSIFVFNLWEWQATSNEFTLNAMPCNFWFSGLCFQDSRYLCKDSLLPSLSLRPWPIASLPVKTRHCLWSCMFCYKISIEPCSDTAGFSGSSDRKPVVVQMYNLMWEAERAVRAAHEAESFQILKGLHVRSCAHKDTTFSITSAALLVTDLGWRLSNQDDNHTGIFNEYLLTSLYSFCIGSFLYSKGNRSANLKAMTSRNSMVNWRCPK